jgi:hypothetical protein
MIGSVKDKAIAIAFLAGALSGCGADHRQSPAELLGADRDEHGCIRSAGYSWCAREASCVRPWELAQKKGLQNTERSLNDYCAKAVQ